MKLMGKRLILRDESQPGDPEDLFRWLNLEEWNYYDEPDAPFVSVSREEFGKRLSNPRKPVSGAHTWHIDTLTGQHLGWVNYYGLDESRGKAMVGIDLPEPDSWSQGYGTEALCLLIDHLFREMGLVEVHTQTWTGNKRMIGLAQRCGFQVTGHSPHRTAVSVRGEPLEFVHFAISRQNWLEGLGR